jgi:hypothetical protein
MLWQELTKIALLGTDNCTFSEQTLRTLQSYGIDTGKEAPLVLATGAALLAQLRKAGFQLEDFDKTLPPAAVATEENLCSFKSAGHLHLILSGRYPAVLGEFFEFLIRNKKRLPPEFIPSLLKQTDNTVGIDYLEKSLSEGGRWLISQHPEWRLLFEKPTVNWQTGSREERLRLLTFFRRHDPPAGLELLQSTWKEESHSDKKAFLLLLRQGLSLADEPFLEQCLEESRKEIRASASNLLAEIPASRLAERMYFRAKECLRWDGRQLQVVIPDVPDAAAERDGVVKTDLRWKGGAKASYLGQVVAATPPERWEVYFQKIPPDIITLFAQTDWPDTLLTACAQAAIQYKDEVWIDTLTSCWFLTARQSLWESEPTTSLLLKAAPAKTVNRIAIQFLEHQRSLQGENSYIFQLFQANQETWEDTLTMLIVRLLQDWLNKASRSDWQSYHNKEYLKLIALRCNPELFDDLQKGWNTTSPLWAFWEKPLEDVLNTVLFRREMRNELSQ